MCRTCLTPQPHPNRDELMTRHAGPSSAAPLSKMPPDGGREPVGAGSYRFNCVGAFLSDEDVNQLGVQSHGAIMPDGSICVLSRGKRQVSIWSPEGDLIQMWDPLPLSLAPHGIHVDVEGTIWIADAYQHVVLKYSPSGSLISCIGVPYVPALAHFGEPFNMPTGVATTPDGEIFVSDGYGNARIHRFDRSSRLLSSWGGRGTEAGMFAVPHFIEYEQGADTLWVCDRENDRIQIFTREGEFVTAISEFSYPNDIAFHGDAAVIAHKAGVSIIDKNSHDIICGWGHDAPYPGATRHPHGIFIDNAGDLYVTEAFGGCQTTKFERAAA